MEDREKVARMITGKPSKMEDGSDDPLHEMDIDTNLEVADQLLALIKQLGYRKSGELLTDEERTPYVRCFEEEVIWDIDGLLQAQLDKGGE